MPDQQFIVEVWFKVMLNNVYVNGYVTTFSENTCNHLTLGNFIDFAHVEAPWIVNDDGSAVCRVFVYATVER